MSAIYVTFPSDDKKSDEMDYNPKKDYSLVWIKKYTHQNEISWNWKHN